MLDAVISMIPELEIPPPELCRTVDPMITMRRSFQMPPRLFRRTRTSSSVSLPRLRMASTYRPCPRWMVSPRTVTCVPRRTRTTRVRPRPVSVGPWPAPSMTTSTSISISPGHVPRTRSRSPSSARSTIRMSDRPVVSWLTLRTWQGGSSAAVAGGVARSVTAAAQSEDRRPTRLPHVLVAIRVPSPRLNVMRLRAATEPVKCIGLGLAGRRADAVVRPVAGH